jgi:hypothetical protein
MVLRGLIVGLMVAGMVGCSGEADPPVPVSGKVLFNGKPLEGARVTFLSEGGSGRSASGQTDGGGNFKLTTNKTNDGAKPGDYVVTIAKIEAKSGGDAGVDISSGDYGEAYGQQMAAAGSNTVNKTIKNVLPAKYGDPKQSGLTRTVVKGEVNEFEFEL